MQTPNWLIDFTASTFERYAIQLFQYQSTQVPVYQEYLQHLKIDANKINQIQSIPFLPISFFKTHTVFSAGIKPILTFESSGTTGTNTSRHLIGSDWIYKKSILEGFEKFYGSPKNWSFLALLPSYLERSNSSLVYMLKVLMEASGHSQNGFYLNNQQELANALKENERLGQKTWLIGVTYALLAFAELFPMPLKNSVVLETGGMKGRRKELTRQAVHGYLKEAFGVASIHSEYGMTELLSQAYAAKDGIFKTPPWMKVFGRDLYNPLQLVNVGESCCLNIIDLSNQESCAFIATDDLGVIYEDGTFIVNGRVDNSDIRGCSLLTF